MGAGWTIRRQTCAKPDGDAGRVNEDAVESFPRPPDFTKGFQRIAVADGAGGYGVFAGDWARELASRLPDAPLASAAQINEWIGGFYAGLAEKWEARARAASPLLHRKFVVEGAWSTLAAVWLQADGAFDFLAVGDTTIFQYDPAPVRFTPLQPAYACLDRYALPPTLIGLNEPLRETGDGIHAGKGQLNDGGRLVLASDGLAQYLQLAWWMGKPADDPDRSAQKAAVKNHHRLAAQWIAWEQIQPAPRFDEAMKGLDVSLETEASFRDWLLREQKTGCLINDDYSLVLCGVEGALE